MGENLPGKIERIIAPTIIGEGLRLVKITYDKEGTDWFLRIFIDRIGGSIGLDDYVKISKKISRILDHEDPIPGSYILEVSSPGV